MLFLTVCSYSRSDRFPAGAYVLLIPGEVMIVPGVFLSYQLDDAMELIEPPAFCTLGSRPRLLRCCICAAYVLAEYAELIGCFVEDA